MVDVKRQLKLLTGLCGNCLDKTWSFHNDKQMPQED
jgi:hypothetical protein